MNLVRKIFQHKETRCTILSDNERAIGLAISSIQRHRKELEEYIRSNPRFLYSLKPVAVNEGPAVARLMAAAAEKACVGPMAAVAGVIADIAVEEMKGEECDVAVVENGGEVSAFSNEPVDIALLAGDSVLSGTFGFRLEDFPCGTATSSGKFSHALSFGDADAVTIFCKDAGLADAAATAVGNIVRGQKPHQVIERAMKRALSIKSVEGAFIMYQGLIGKTGRVPQIIKLRTEKTTTPFLEFLKTHITPTILHISEAALDLSDVSDLGNAMIQNHTF